jgi:hypothetical protein
VILSGIRKSMDRDRGVGSKFYKQKHKDNQ